MLSGLNPNASFRLVQEKLTNFYVHSSVASMPLSTELDVWLVRGGGCNRGRGALQRAPRARLA